MDAQRSCFVCEKQQRWPATLRIHTDDLGVVTHASGDPIYLGYLYIEPQRHAPGW